MTLAQRALFRVLVVALVTVLALMLAAPTSRRELAPLVGTPTGTTWHSGPGDTVEVTP